MASTIPYAGTVLFLLALFAATFGCPDFIPHLIYFRWFLWLCSCIAWKGSWICGKRTLHHAHRMHVSLPVGGCGRMFLLYYVRECCYCCTGRTNHLHDWFTHSFSCSPAS